MPSERAEYLGSGMGGHLSAAATGAALALTAAAAALAAGAPGRSGVLLLLLAVLIASRWCGRAAGYAAALTGVTFSLVRLVTAGPQAGPDVADAVALVLLGVIGGGIAAWTGQRPAPAPAGDPRRVKEEFLATVSHELRTPLNSILGWTALLRTPRAMPPQQMDRGLEVIERNARRQLALVEELIVAAEPETSPDLWQSLDIRQTLTGVLHALEPAATTAGVGLVLEEGADSNGGVEPVLVRGDAASLRLAFRHVLDNAVKYSPAGANVRVRLRPCGAQALVFVSDTGGGLAVDRVEQLFEPFRQADGTATRRFGGLGLGLTIARKLIERHGGHVDLRSDGPSGGSTVLVTLPLAPPQSA